MTTTPHKRKITYPLLTGFTLTLILLVCLSLIDPVRHHIPKKDPETPDFKLTTIKVVHINHGQKQWEFHAERAEIYKKNHQAVMWSPEGRFFSNNDPIFDLTSPKAHLNLESSELTFFDLSGVWIVKNDRMAMTGDKFFWNPKSEKLIGKGRVKFFNETMALSCDTVVADPKSKKIDFSGEPNILLIKEM